MSWATYKAEITGALTGYTELPQNLEPEQATKGQNHKYYSLKPVNSQNDHYTSSVEIGSHIVELKMGFVGLNNSDNASNYDLFDGVIDTIKGLSNYKGWAENPSWGIIDAKRQIGTARFYYGIRVL